jgi:hypothetical protein
VQCPILQASKVPVLDILHMVVISPLLKTTWPISVSPELLQVLITSQQDQVLTKDFPISCHQQQEEEEEEEEEGPLNSRIH